MENTLKDTLEDTLEAAVGVVPWDATVLSAATGNWMAIILCYFITEIHTRSTIVCGLKPPLYCQPT